MSFPAQTSDSVAFGEMIPVVRDKSGWMRSSWSATADRSPRCGSANCRRCPARAGSPPCAPPPSRPWPATTGRCRCRCSTTRNFAEITHPDIPASGLICCRNPALAAQRAAKRESRAAATEEELGKIRASVQAGRLKDAGKIGIKAGKVINKRKVGKHFITDIGDGRFGWRRDEDKIAAEAALDGIYVIRTSAAADKLGTGETVEAYKDLGNLERDFWSMKAEDIDLRPIYHYLENRVRSHVLCACSPPTSPGTFARHWRRSTFTDNTKPTREDPVIPARRSAAATAKDTGENHPGQAARPRLPRIGRPSGHTHQKQRQLRRETPRKTDNADPRTAPRLRSPRQAHPAQPRRTVTTVPTNGAAQ